MLFWEVNFNHEPRTEPAIDGKVGGTQLKHGTRWCQLLQGGRGQEASAFRTLKSAIELLPNDAAHALCLAKQNLAKLKSKHPGVSEFPSNNYEEPN